MLARRRSVPSGPRWVAMVLGGGRIAFGAWMAAAPSAFLVAARTPREDINDNGRLLSRMVGARDVILGANLLRHLDDRDQLRAAALLTSGADLTDTVWLGLLARRPGYFEAGAAGVAVAASAAAGFIALARSLD